MTPVHTCILLLVLLPIISAAGTTLDAAVPLESLADLPSFVYYRFGLNFSERWKKCIEYGPDICPVLYAVGEEGPCQEGELLLYNRPEALRASSSFEPVCQPAPCPDGFGLVLPEKKCYHYDDIQHRICSEGQRPMKNLFGETFCSCLYPKATLLGSKGKECYEVFTQGPCTRGSLFVPVNDLVNFGQGQCLPSPCAKLLNGTRGMVEIRLPNGRTECFERGSKGPCDTNHFLSVSSGGSVLQGVLHVSCAMTGLDIAFHFASSELCVVDDKGQCVKPLKKKADEQHPLEIEDQ